MSLRWAPRALEGGPSERQHLLGVGREWGAKDYQRSVAGGRRDLAISAADVQLLAARPCTRRVGFRM